MSTENWVPAGLNEEEAEDYLELRPDVPTWMWRPLFDWLYTNLTSLQTRSGGFGPTQHRVTVSNLQLIASAARVQLTPTPDGLSDSLRKLNGRQMIALTSTVLHMGSFKTNPAAIGTLRAILKTSQSMWTVADTDGTFDLSRVLPEGIHLEAERTIQVSGTAGSVLARAWNALYGIEPRPSSAYADAVKAVEIAAQPVIEPRNKMATLGTMNARMADPHVPISTVLRDKARYDQKETLVRLIDLLWHGHEDRHGKQDYSDVTIGQAQAGLAIATTLVGLFSSGAISVGSSN